MINTTPCVPGDLPAVLDAMYELRLPCFLWGKPGIGKSDLIRQFCRERNMRLIDVRLTTLESVDMRGLPWIKEDETHWMRPEFLPKEDDNRPTVIFLDELVAAEPRIQASAYQLILDRAIGQHRLPDNTWVLGAGNAPEDGAISYAMGSALADRFMHIQVVPNSQDWIKWALTSGIAPEVITFIKVKPEYLDTPGEQTKDKVEKLITPSPRSWERVSKVLQKAESRNVRSIAINGLVGEHVAVQFFHVVEEVGQLPPMEELMRMKPQDAVHRIPKTVPALYGLTYSLVSYCQDLDNLQQAMLIFNELPNMKAKELPTREIETLGMEMLFGKAQKLKLLEKLTATEAYKKGYKQKARELVK